MPPELGAAEAPLTSLLSDTITRGTVNVTVRLQLSPELKTASLQIDEELAAATVGKLRHLAERTGVSPELRLGEVIGLPGVVSIETSPALDETGRETVLAAAQAALANHSEARRAEGRHLQKHLRDFHRQLVELLGSMSARQDDVLRHHRDRLLARIEMLDVRLKLDDERLAKEVAFAAQKSDISEELARLEGHLKTFAELIDREGDPVGRQLQFVCQEIQREINTLCSKAAETETAGEGIQFKTVLEKVREQIANIE